MSKHGLDCYLGIVIYLELLIGVCERVQVTNEFVCFLGAGLY